MKKTPWFPAGIKPVREGPYEVWSATYESAGWYAWWDGKKWGPAFKYGGQKRSIRISYGCRQSAGAIQDRHWRGLAQKP